MQLGPESVTFAEEGELTAEDVLTLALDDLLTTTILGDYVLQFVKPPQLWAEPLPFPSGWLWLRRPYGEVIRLELLEDASGRTLWSNWLGLEQCLLTQTNALGLVRERVRKLPPDKKEHLAELARNVAERLGLSLASLDWDRPLERLFSGRLARLAIRGEWLRTRDAVLRGAFLRSWRSRAGYITQ